MRSKYTRCEWRKKKAKTINKDEKRVEYMSSKQLTKTINDDHNDDDDDDDDDDDNNQIFK